MAEYSRVARANEVPRGRGTVVEVEGKKIALFNVEGRFYAIDNTCTHRGGPLGEGNLRGSTVTCPWHGAQFDVRSGQVLASPAAADVSTYPIKMEEDSVWVAVS